MTQFQELTVTYKYIEGDEFREWFNAQVNSRICAVKANQNKQVQVTGWSEGDVIKKLQEIEE